MKKITLLYVLIALALCDYKKLSKYSSVSVKPDTQVYLDLKSFNTGDIISLEIKLDLFFSNDRSNYIFNIDQIPATTYNAQYYWDHLRTVVNKNVTCSSTHICKFSWEEIKREVNNYIYIEASAHFWGYYSTWRKEITILSSGAIAGIVIGVLVPLNSRTCYFLYKKKKKKIR